MLALSAACRLLDRTATRRQRNRLRPHCRRSVRSLPAQCHVYRPGQRPAAVTWSRKKEFRLIRPLVFVTEDLTRAFAQSLGAPVIPCGCSQKTGTVRRSLRDILDELAAGHPFLKETLISAMGRIDPSRLLDTRFLNLDEGADEAGFLEDETDLVAINTR